MKLATHLQMKIMTHRWRETGRLLSGYLRSDIDALNDRIYRAVNNGVYQAGFATTQEAYEEAAFAVFSMLDELEERLAGKRYLFGDHPVETTGVSSPPWSGSMPFMSVTSNVICAGLVDYPNLSRYARDLFQLPDIARTVNFEHIRKHYYTTRPA